MYKSALLIALSLLCAMGQAQGKPSDPRPADFNPSFDSAIQSWHEEDYASAFRQFKALAEHGSATSEYYLGLQYHRGWGVAKDDAQAAIWLRKAAQQRNALAQNELGSMYRYGWGVPADADKARAWYRKAAEQGLAAAQNNLADMLGTFVSSRHEDAGIVWLRRAAAQGDPIYQLKLGKRYGVSGASREQLVKSAFWLRKAAIQGLGPAEDSLGAYYLYGIGVRKNALLARIWLQRGYAHGSGQAAYTLGSMYEGGTDDVAKDQASALIWYCRAAQMGYGGATNAITRLRDLGDAGRSCIMNAATAGNAWAQYILGDVYAYSGDSTDAVVWYRKSATQGEEFALLALAHFYAAGKGVPRDLVIARTLAYLSEVSGGPAYSFFAELDRQLTPAQRTEAAEWADAWKPGTPLPENSETWKAVQKTQAK